MSGREGGGTHQDTEVPDLKPRVNFLIHCHPPPKSSTKLSLYVHFMGRALRAFTNHSKELSHSVKMKKEAQS